MIKDNKADKQEKVIVKWAETNNYIVRESDYWLIVE